MTSPLNEMNGVPPAKPEELKSGRAGVSFVMTIHDPATGETKHFQCEGEVSHGSDPHDSGAQRGLHGGSEPADSGI